MWFESLQYSISLKKTFHQIRQEWLGVDFVSFTASLDWNRWFGRNCCLYPPREVTNKTPLQLMALLSGWFSELPVFLRDMLHPGRLTLNLQNHPFFKRTMLIFQGVDCTGCHSCYVLVFTHMAPHLTSQCSLTIKKLCPSHFLVEAPRNLPKGCQFTIPWGFNCTYWHPLEGAGKDVEINDLHHRFTEFLLVNCLMTKYD